MPVLWVSEIYEPTYWPYKQEFSIGGGVGFVLDNWFRNLWVVRDDSPKYGRPLRSNGGIHWPTNSSHKILNINLLEIAQVNSQFTSKPIEGYIEGKGFSILGRWEARLKYISGTTIRAFRRVLCNATKWESYKGRIVNWGFLTPEKHHSIPNIDNSKHYTFWAGSTVNLKLRFHWALVLFDRRLHLLLLGDEYWITVQPIQNSAWSLGCQFRKARLHANGLTFLNVLQQTKIS